jgi:hypothetical protein
MSCLPYICSLSFLLLMSWAHNSNCTDVANPHNHIDDVPLAAGTPVVVDGVVDVHLGYYDRSSP